MSKLTKIPKSPINQNKKPIQLEEFLTEDQKKQKMLQLFEPQLIVIDILDEIIDKGGELLYENYINKKIVPHAKNFVFDSLNGLLGINLFKIQDGEKNKIDEIQEENLIKAKYDSKCAFTMKTEKKYIIMPDEEENVEQSQMEAGQSLYKKSFGVSNKSFRTQRSVSSQLPRNTIKSKMNSQQQNGGQKQKQKNDIDDANIVQLVDPTLTESQQEYKKIEDKLRYKFVTRFNDELNQKKEEQRQKLEAKQNEKAIQKRLKDLETKKYTYDYDGNIMFNEEKKMGQKNQNKENTVNLKYGVSDGPKSISKHYKHVLIRPTSNEKNGRKRIQSMHAKQQQIDDETYEKYYLEPEPVIVIEDKTKKVKGNVISKLQHNNISVQKGFIKKLKKQVSIPEDVFNNGGKRQTSTIPLIKLEKGVTLTEHTRNGPLVAKSEYDQQNSSVNSNNPNQRMKRSEYLEFIEHNRFVPGIHKVIEENRQKNQGNVQNQQINHVIPSQMLPSEIFSEKDSKREQDQSYMSSTSNGIQKHILGIDNQKNDQILQKRLQNDSGNLNYNNKKEYDVFQDLDFCSKHPVKIIDRSNNKIIQNIQENQLKMQKQSSQLKYNNQKNKINNINDNYYKDFVESPVKVKIQQQKEKEQRKQEIEKNKQTKQNYNNSHQELPKIIQNPKKQILQQLKKDNQQSEKKIQRPRGNSQQISNTQNKQQNMRTQKREQRQQRSSTQQNETNKSKNQSNFGKENQIGNNKIMIQKKGLINMLVN